MNKIRIMRPLPGYCTLLQLGLLSLLSGGALADDAAASCERQAGDILARLEAEVVGALDGAQRRAANDIVLDVCREREAAVEVQVQEAVEQAREEEREKADDFWVNKPDKAGNKRLKRKSH